MTKKKDICARLRQHITDDRCLLPANETVYKVKCADVLDAMDEIMDLRRKLSEKVTSALFCEEPIPLVERTAND
jgi:hypothetical protein